MHNHFTMLVCTSLPSHGTRAPSRCTALVNAAANSHVAMCKYLVQEAADVNARCRSGNTALVYAAMHGDIDLVKFLHKKGVRSRSLCRGLRVHFHVHHDIY